jgi:hypothetical protein
MTNRHNNSAEIRAKIRSSKASFTFDSALAAARELVGTVKEELGLDEFAAGAKLGHDLDRASWN